ncbi:hypothetical protein ElyMa_000929400 [Elysia marginata]|uniref:Uncharacterized protein n=1 Tax=Elysia marginata TaxID=1093978 RepID=A0AAV4H9H6_9GAST|nr:hypothetical protein ElyMa_000929400 [Elysia marginata]
MWSCNTSFGDLRSSAGGNPPVGRTMYLNRRQEMTRAVHSPETQRLWVLTSGVRPGADGSSAGLNIHVYREGERMGKIKRWRTPLLKIL